MWIHWANEQGTEKKTAVREWKKQTSYQRRGEWQRDRNRFANTRGAYLFSVFDQIATVLKQMYRRLFTDAFLSGKVILAFSWKHESERGKKWQSLITLDAQIAQWCIRLTCLFYTLLACVHSWEIVSQHFCPFFFTTEIERRSCTVTHIHSPNKLYSCTLLSIFFLISAHFHSLFSRSHLIS